MRALRATSRIEQPPKPCSANVSRAARAMRSRVRSPLPPTGRPGERGASSVVPPRRGGAIRPTRLRLPFVALVAISAIIYRTFDRLSTAACRHAPAPRAASLHPAVHGTRPRLGHQEVVPDRLAAALLDGARGRDQAEDVRRLVSVLGLGVGMHLEVLDRQAVVLLEPLVEGPGVAAARRHPLAGVAEHGQPLLVRTTDVVEDRAGHRDRLGERPVGTDVVVGEPELAEAGDLYQHVSRIVLAD